MENEKLEIFAYEHQEFDEDYRQLRWSRVEHIEVEDFINREHPESFKASSASILLSENSQSVLSVNQTGMTILEQIEKQTLEFNRNMALAMGVFNNSLEEVKDAYAKRNPRVNIDCIFRCLPTEIKVTPL